LTCPATPRYLHSFPTRRSRDFARCSATHGVESGRGLRHKVAVAHPNLLLAFHSPKQGTGPQQIKLGESVFPALAFLNSASQQMCDQLLAVADAEDSASGTKHARIDGGAAGVVDAGWPAGDDDAFSAGEIGGGSFAGRDFGVDSKVANLARNEMAVLPPRVKYGYLWLQSLDSRGLKSPLQ